MTLITFYVVLYRNNFLQLWFFVLIIHHREGIEGQIQSDSNWIRVIQSINAEEERRWCDYKGVIMVKGCLSRVFFLKVLSWVFFYIEKMVQEHQEMEIKFSFYDFVVSNKNHTHHCVVYR